MFSSKDLFFTPASTGYTVSKSLRFRSSASAYLNRTPASAGNQQKWTFSCWAKLGKIGFGEFLGSYLSNTDTGNFEFRVTSGGSLQVVLWNYLTTTNAVLRDPSAWYHIVLVIDTTQAATSSGSKIKMYVNGVLQSFSTDQISSSIAQNTNLLWNSTTTQYIGRWYISDGGNYFIDGYLADVNFIGGSALDPTSFGEYDTNGIWQPKAYTGSYSGTNSFYLKYTDVGTTSGSNTGYGQDFSGNGNYWTTNNLSSTTGTTYDSMLDSPTNATGDIGNYAVLNPLNLWQGSATTSVTNGNLTCAASSAGTGGSAASIGILSGQFYWETQFTTIPGGNFCGAGLYDTSVVLGGANSYVRTGHWILSDLGLFYANGAAGTASGTGAFSAGDTAIFAFDGTTGKLWVGKNGTWVGTPGTSGEIATLTTGKTYAPLVTMYYSGSSGVTTSNFGQRPFAYTPPSGFSALNTQNLSTPTITNGAQYMAATLWSGNGTSQTINNGTNNTIGTTFQPDFVWGKLRNTAYNHALTDVVRGATKLLNSDTIAAEQTLTDTITAFNTNGFSVGANTYFNGSGYTYVGWQWKAGGTGVSNTSGSITSTVSANTSAGFSVVTFTSTASTQSVGHGLGVTPSMIILKNRSTTGNWGCYHQSLGVNSFINLNSTAAAATVSNIWAVSSSTFTPDQANLIGGSGITCVAYCFAPVAGYSAFGSYTGNGSADGPFVYTGFRPRWIMIKSSTAAEAWYIIDTSRDTYNAALSILAPNLSSAEFNNGSTWADVISNGFKIRYNSGPFNTSSATYIYACFAENPFKISRAR